MTFDHVTYKALRARSARRTNFTSKRIKKNHDRKVRKTTWGSKVLNDMVFNTPLVVIRKNTNGTKSTKTCADPVMSPITFPKTEKKIIKKEKPILTAFDDSC